MTCFRESGDDNFVIPHSMFLSAYWFCQGWRTLSTRQITTQSLILTKESTRWYLSGECCRPSFEESRGLGSWHLVVSFLNTAIQCPREGNKCFEYTACETACPKTCENLCDVTPARCPVRFEGCSCPNGTVLHDGKCIEPGSCPCHVGGVHYKPGSIIVKDCQRWWAFLES